MRYKQMKVLKKQHPENPRYKEYYHYLNNHIGGVQESWRRFLAPVVVKVYPDEYDACEKSVANHDKSKYDNREFIPYLNHFYPTEDFPDDQEAFDLAWLRHSHVNPHHWQYWCLIRDEGIIEPMDMPISEVVNMCCDWHSFSARDPKSTAYSWYMDNQNNMILSDNTRELVNFFIQYLKDPLPNTWK